MNNDKIMEIKKIKNQIEMLDRKNYLLKILLNRIYGYFAEKHSPVYDIDLAASVTLTGQACIKEAAKLSNEFIKQQYGLDYDSIIMSDTDSICLTIQPILEKNGETFLKNDEINPYVYKVAKDVNEMIDKGINKWGKEVLHSNHCAYEFKRENISQIGAFLKKKNYILNIRDDEGRKVNKFLYKGVQVVKTSTPKKIKPMLKHAIENVLIIGDKKQTEIILKQVYEEYQKLTIEEIAIPMSLNNLEKYKALSNGFKIAKRTPINVKSAIYFNLLLEEFDLTKTFESLKGGNKMKFTYVQPNKYDIETIGFLNIFPEEFKQILTPNIQLMFEKTVLRPIYAVLEQVDWEVRNPLLEETNDLLELFS